MPARDRLRRGLDAALALAPAPRPLPARFPLGAARRVPVRDAESGRPLVGVEDVALAGDRLILSATDRAALERDPAGAPEGGLYALALAELDRAAPLARPLLDAGARARLSPGGLFPHGIAVSADGARLAAVLRPRGGGEVAVAAGRLEGERLADLRRRACPLLRHANDLDFAPEGPFVLRVTLSRRRGPAAPSEMRPAARTGRVVALDLDSGAPAVEIARGLAFANGIAGETVAETRAFALASLRDGRRLSLPGGPDNLTLDAEGAVVAALHPRLLRLGLWRGRFASRAPSRAVRVTPDGDVEILFDDPRGEAFSGASVALLLGDRLVLGSPMDAGLLLVGPQR